MSFFSHSRRAKPRGFRLETRYTDERKQRLNLMDKRAKNVISDVNESRSERREALSQAWDAKRSTGKVDPQRTMRLLVILMVLIAIVFFGLQFIDAFMS